MRASQLAKTASDFLSDTVSPLVERGHAPCRGGCVYKGWFAIYVMPQLQRPPVPAAVGSNANLRRLIHPSTVFPTGIQKMGRIDSRNDAGEESG